MSYLKKLFESEKNIHRVFEVSLILKGLFAALEIIGGALAYFVSQQFLLSVVSMITADELAEDPRDCQFRLYAATIPTASGNNYTCAAMCA